MRISNLLLIALLTSSVILNTQASTADFPDQAFSWDLIVESESVAVVDPPAALPLKEGKKGIILKAADFWIGLPGKESSMVFLKIAKGTRVIVMDEMDEYCKVHHRELIGYIERKLVKIVEPEPATELRPVKEETEPAPAKMTARTVEKEGATSPNSGKLYTVSKATSLRAGPDHRENVYLRLPGGGMVTVLDNSGKWWWKVKYKGQVGWAKRALLTKE